LNKFALFILIICGFLITATARTAVASREITIGYQGVIESKGQLLDGTGFFKFALCSLDCNTTYWSNDDSSVNGSEPSGLVSIQIDSGIFNLMLGDTSLTGMAEIPLSVFEDIGDENLYLRVWFDDGYNGFEQLTPDQRLSIAPYAAKTEMVGGVVSVDSMEMTGYLNLNADDLSSSDGVAFKIADPTETLFSVDERGTAYSRDITLQPLTSASDLSRLTTGRFYYDGSTNKFMGCNNSRCSEIGLAGTSGVADITSVTAGTGLTGGATSGNATLSVDTTKVVTKTGDHTMAGSLTASTLSAPTVTSTQTMNAVALNASGTVSANAVNIATVATTGGVTMPPTGTEAGNTAEVQFRELAINGNHYVGFKAPDDILMSKIWTLPAADGAPNQILKTDGSGALSWTTDIHEGGDITAVTAGTGLDGGAISGTASLGFEYAKTLESNTLAGGTEVFYLADDGGGILFEGETQDDIEGRLTVADLQTTDKTWTLPDKSGTVLIGVGATNCTSIVTGELDPTEVAGTNYLNLVDNTVDADETAADMFMVPVAMTAGNLLVKVDTAPGDNKGYWTITFRAAGAPTDPAMTCQITGTDTQCTDATNAPSIAAGSKLDIQVTSTQAGDPLADPTAALEMTVSFCLGP